MNISEFGWKLYISIVFCSIPFISLFYHARSYRKVPWSCKYLVEDFLYFCPNFHSLLISLTSGVWKYTTILYNFSRNFISFYWLIKYLIMMKYHEYKGISIGFYSSNNILHLERYMKNIKYYRNVADNLCLHIGNYQEKTTSS